MEGKCLKPYCRCARGLQFHECLKPCCRCAWGLQFHDEKPDYEVLSPTAEAYIRSRCWKQRLYCSTKDILICLYKYICRKDISIYLYTHVYRHIQICFYLGPCYGCLRPLAEGSPARAANRMGQARACALAAWRGPGPGAPGLDAAQRSGEVRFGVNRLYTCAHTYIAVHITYMYIYICICICIYVHAYMYTHTPHTYT